MGFSLVIVESPAKCKKIEQILGSGYKCVASFGHIRTLPSLEYIDKFFHPTYVVDETKAKNIEYLRKQIAVADEVILATDDDREGEAISWHICDLFGLSPTTTKRIIFHEITKEAIQRAVAHPKLLDLNMVQSQKSRQILDLLVGFKISPLLWKYVSKDRHLSAGRCQTPALRLIYDKHIEEDTTKQVYNTIGYFTSLNLPFELNKQLTKDNIEAFLEDSVNFEHIYTCSSPKPKIMTAPEPLTTSSLQQKASTDLHISPKECMKLAQELYENGYITYMRTDSKKYSKEFIESAKKYITNKFNNEKFVSANIGLLEVGQVETKRESSRKKKIDQIAPPQEAHEAIRPSDLTIQTIKDTEISPKAIKLYTLIWQRSLESCMSNATLSVVKVTISAPNDAKYCFEASQMVFSGWMEVTKKYEQMTNGYQFMQTLLQDSVLNYKKIVSNTTLIGKKTHYTEASLVKTLEDIGIGRPSTFSMLVDKIQERGYVEKTSIEGTNIECIDYTLEDDELSEQTSYKTFGKETNKLVITQKGIIVMEFLLKYFEPLFDYKYTSIMENELDEISKGTKLGTEICKQCNIEIETLMENITGKQFEIELDESHQLIIGKYGPVIKSGSGKNATFLPVRKDINLKELNNVSLENIIDPLKEINTRLLGKYNNADLYIKKGKYGLYLQWNDSTKSLKDFGNKPIESFIYEDMLVLLEKDGGILDPDTKPGIVREISKELSIRNGKYGDYIYYKTSRMKQPKFFKLQGFNCDHKTCDIALIKNWIEITYLKKK
jgi:DNA topoisomerase I